VLNKAAAVEAEKSQEQAESAALTKSAELAEQAELAESAELAAPGEQSEPAPPAAASSSSSSSSSELPSPAAETSYDVFPDFKPATTASINTAAKDEPLDELADLPGEDLEAEMSALDAAAEAAMFEDVQDSDEITERPASAEEITAEDLEAVRATVYNEPEVTTSPDLPAVPNARAGQGDSSLMARTSGDRENKPQTESSGDWKIVSLPGSDIASLFLGEDHDSAATSGSDLDAVDSGADSGTGSASGSSSGSGSGSSTGSSTGPAAGPNTGTGPNTSGGGRHGKRRRR